MPIGHLLAPQIMKKAQELEAEIAPPASKAYLQPAGYEKTPFDPRGLLNKPEPKSFDPRDAAIAGGMQNLLGTLQRSGDPRQQAFAKGAGLGMDDSYLKGFRPIPNAPEAPRPVGKRPKTKPGTLAFLPGEVIGVTETGVPILAPEQKGQIALSAKPGQAIGTTERGEPVDIKGKKVGYLKGPAIVTPYGETPMRTAERKPSDISAADRDTFAYKTLESLYGKHLQEVEDNRDARGFPTDKFPSGYFKGMSKAEREAIIKGVDALRKIKKGPQT